MGKLGSYLCGRRLYETMLVWATDPPLRYPVAVGGGTSFLPPVTEDIALNLIETMTFGSRVIYERYGRVRDEPD